MCMCMRCTVCGRKYALCACPCCMRMRMYAYALYMRVYVCVYALYAHALHVYALYVHTRVYALQVYVVNVHVYSACACVSVCVMSLSRIPCPCWTCLLIATQLPRMDGVVVFMRRGGGGCAVEIGFWNWKDSVAPFLLASCVAGGRPSPHTLDALFISNWVCASHAMVMFFRDLAVCRNLIQPLPLSAFCTQ